MAISKFLRAAFKDLRGGKFYRLSMRCVPVGIGPSFLAHLQSRAVSKPLGDY